MRKLTIICLVILPLILGCKGVFNGVKITGNAKNSNREYLYLAHQPLYRGSYNADGFKSIGDWVDDKGNFKLASDNLIDAADYWIQIKDKAFHLILFKGDDLKLDFDLRNLDSSLFVQGKGAGKINALRLAQFESSLEYDTIYTMDAYKSVVDSTIAAQLTFLDLIYQKDIENKLIQNAENKQSIIKIITQTPLSKKEYEFLKKQISIQDIYFLAGFPKFLQEQGKLSFANFDFSIPYFSCFNPSRYKEFENINFWQFEDCINRILEIEYLKTHQKENKYLDWSFAFAKNTFHPEVFDAYFSSLLLSDLSRGSYEKDMYEKFVNNCMDRKYLNSVNRYVNLLENGLNNAEYNLNDSNLTLDSLKLDKLTKSYRGRDLYLVIWSAQFAGSTIISALPSIVDFEREEQGKIEILYLCIDENKYKNQWTARIIDNSWKTNHYFLPSENNQNIIKHFSAQNISGFCYGGVTYSFIDKNGKLTNNVEAPILLTKEKIERYTNSTLR